MQRKYTWRPQLPDFRDFKLQAVSLDAASLQPSKSTLRSFVKEVYDQGESGSCTGNAIAQAIRITQAKENFLDIPPSRMFIYYNERLKEGNPLTDAGADLRDGMKIVADFGAGYELSWPFNLASMYTKPPAAVYQQAVQNMVKTYSAVNQSLIDLKQCIISGYPFVFGFSVYDSFESRQVAATGIVPFPQNSEKQLGGHAVCCVGFDDSTSTFEVANSWGPNWGDQGFFHIPYSYLTDPDLASDFWSISMLETQNDPARKWVVAK